MYSYDGTNLTTFSGGAITGTGPGADCPYTWWEEIVLALCEYEGDLVIGGNFFRADSLPVSNLVSFTTSGAAILGDARGLGAGEYTSFLGADDAGVTVLGPDPQCFTVGGFQSYDLDTWDGSTWRKIGVWTGFYPFISMNTVVDGRLYLAGRGFVASGDTLSYQSMAVWNGQQWESGPPVYGYDDSQYFFVKPMYCMARYGSTFVAGGAIPPPGGDEDTETQVGILNGDVWSPLGSSFQGSRVDALVEYQGDLIAGGTFESSDSIPLNNVARWNGSTWEPMGDGLPGSVEFLAVSGDQLIANGVALWNGTQWFNIGAGLEFYSGPDHLISQDGCIIMTGMALAGRPKSMLKWDGDAWSEFIYGAEGTFGKFNSDYYCAAGAPVFGGQRPARWIASGQSAVVAISPPRRHGLTVSIAQNPIAGSLDLLLGETSTPRIVVDIFDVAGRRVVAGLVATSSAGRLVLSPRELTDSGSAIQNGVYLVRVSDGNVEGIAKFVVLR